MAIELKLEIFKLTLKNKETGRRENFRDIFREKFGYYNAGKNNGKTVTEIDVFRKFYQDFVNSIDLKKYLKSDKKKKGFTIAKIGDGENERSDISPITANDWVISGKLKGGSHGRNRFLDDLDDTSKTTPVKTSHIVCDKYYFLLYIPINGNQAIFMVQGYTGDRIADVFGDFLNNYFKHENKITNTISICVPRSFREQYKNHAVVKSVVFSTLWEVKPESGEGELSQKECEIQLKIEITDKSDNKNTWKRIKALRDAFKNSSIFVSDKSSKQLKDFPVQRAKVSDGKQELFVDFNDGEINPSLRLSTYGINPDASGIPDFGKLETFCRSLLEELKVETDPNNALDDL